jgi:hypothetical protein
MGVATISRTDYLPGVISKSTTGHIVIFQSEHATLCVH